MLIKALLMWQYWYGFRENLMHCRYFFISFTFWRQMF